VRAADNRFGRPQTDNRLRQAPHTVHRTGPAQPPSRHLLSAHLLGGAATPGAHAGPGEQKRHEAQAHPEEVLRQRPDQPAQAAHIDAHSLSETPASSHMP
jgi:hypothetical protein